MKKLWLWVEWVLLFVVTPLIAGWGPQLQALDVPSRSIAAYGNLIFTIGLGNYFLENGLPLRL